LSAEAPFPEPLSAEALHERYAPRIERLILRLLGADSDREDVRQDVLMTVVRKAHTLRNPESLDFWVTQVTINTLRYAMRRRRLRRHLSWDAVCDRTTPSIHPSFEDREIAARAVRVLDRLPEADRTLLHCYWFSSSTAAEIAERTRCSLMTIRRRLFRARRRFERLARRDPELARCLDEAAVSSRRWRYGSLRASA